MAIDPISAKALASAIQKAGASSTAETQTLGGVTAGGGGFADSLKQWLDSVNDSAGVANQAVNGMVNGTADVHTAMIALQRADTMLELTVQVRNKLVSAYQDVMRMPM
jgi:flagellar hook-basal body complex protein FliE